LRHVQAIVNNASYRRADNDIDFLARDGADRPARLPDGARPGACQCRGCAGEHQHSQPAGNVYDWFGSPAAYIADALMEIALQFEASHFAQMRRHYETITPERDDDRWQPPCNKKTVIY
jgi:hypothetical protein